MRNNITLAITGFVAGAAALVSGVALAQVSSSTAPAGTSAGASLSTSTNALYPGSPASPSSITNTGTASGSTTGTSGSVTPSSAAGTVTTGTGMGSATGNPSGGSTGYLMTNTPAPEVVTVDENGTALVRGRVLSASGNSLTLQSWGGTWTIQLGANPSVYGGTSNPGTSLANIPVGDFVGADGVVSASQPYAIEATIVRDWTTNPYTGSSAGGATSSSGIGTGSSTSLPSSSTSATGTTSGTGGLNSTGGVPSGTSGAPGTTY